MKTFRTAFPYVIATAMPEDLEILLEQRAFDGLGENAREGQGWSQLVSDTRLLQVDGKYLLRYLSCKRKPDAAAAKRLADERLEQAAEAGREITTDLQLQMQAQAENELIKYAPVTSNAVYLLVCPEKRLLIASGGTVNKCEDALSYLRKTLGSLSAEPWGDTLTLTTAITEIMTAKQNFYILPENLSISAFGKTLFTGSDNSLKIVLDGVQNDSDEAKNMLAGMYARSVEMSLVKRPDNGQIENRANFTLQMPQAGNIHFKKYDYDDDVEREDLAQAFIAEMHLVISYTKEILAALELFTGMKIEEPEQG